VRLGGFPEVDQLAVPGGTACGHGSGGIPSSWFRASPFSAWSIRASYNHPSTWNSSLKLARCPHALPMQRFLEFYFSQKDLLPVDSPFLAEGMETTQVTLSRSSFFILDTFAATTYGVEVQQPMTASSRIQWIVDPWPLLGLVNLRFKRELPLPVGQRDSQLSSVLLCRPACAN